MYLSNFIFPEEEVESDFYFSQKRTCFDSYYPFGILSKKRLRRLDFEPITILYGGNGSGKTTALNIVAEKLNLERESLYNRSNFFEDYTALCKYKVEKKIPSHSRIITSDDIFNFMLNLRSLNLGIDSKREKLFEEYIENKSSRFRMESLADYEKLKKANLAKGKTQSKYVREHLVDNVRSHSNGESSFIYFTEKIQNDALYLLDEPENSLSPERQLELLSFIEDSARFYGCQFIISTHSPFLLSARTVKIYDLDEDPVDVKRWTELRNIKVYYNLFKKYEMEFKDY